MGYMEERINLAKSLVGKRIEIPVHYDLWMRGARFGTVTSQREGNIKVKMEHPQVKRRLTIWRLDLDYIRLE